MEDNQNKENSPIQEDKAKKSINVKVITTIVVVIILVVAVIIVGICIFNNANEDDGNNDKKSENKVSSFVDEDEIYDDEDDYSYEDDDYYSEYYYTSNELAEMEENLVIEKIGETEYGEIVFSIENNNKETVYIDDVNIILKDEDGTFLYKAESAVSYFAIAGKSEIVLFTYEGSDELPEYSSYEFQVELDDYKESNTVVENFEISSVNNGKSIAAEVVNNNEFAVSDIELGIVYYKNGEVVGIDWDYDMSTVKSGSSAYITLDYAYDSEYEDITDFDDYEIYLYYAIVEE